MPRSARFRAVARLGAVTLVAGILALLPASAAASDLLGKNLSGHLTADDPRIALTPPPPPPPQLTVHQILAKAAADQGVDPNLLLAVSYWESGWSQAQVSSEGAVGLLQVMPKTAITAGPALLHRQVNIQDPMDNAEVGAALLKDLLNKYPARTALAAYYQGEPALLSGHYAADTWHYADSILTLAAQIAAGQGPPAN